MENHFPLNETRAQFQWDPIASNKGEVHLNAELLQDEILHESSINLREAYLYLFPSSSLEIKAGRQVLTWGVGDFIFINDLFPKNWQSFFIGREDAYLKDPSTSIKISWFPKPAFLDLVWTPIFTPDTYISGERLSFFDTRTKNIEGGSGLSILRAKEPELKIENSELALRLWKNIQSTELALYSYYGFYKRPLGLEKTLGRKSYTQKLIFPKLTVSGAIIRGNLLKGIGKMEAGYYHSLDDQKGDDPMIENSDLKGLLGYQKELMKDLTISLQYHFEYMLYYDDYVGSFSLQDEEIEKDEVRHLITTRVTKLLKMQTINLSLFAFFSPSDEDGYLLPSFSYQWTDQINITCGGNIFFGEKEHTFFGMFRHDSNVYARLRYGY